MRCSKRILLNHLASARVSSVGGSNTRLEFTGAHSTLRETKRLYSQPKIAPPMAPSTRA